MHFHDDGGVLQLFLLDAVALSLKFADLLEGLFENPVEALFVHTEVGDDVTLLAVGFGHGEGGADARVIGVDAVFVLESA